MSKDSKQMYPFSTSSWKGSESVMFSPALEQEILLQQQRLGEQSPLDFTGSDMSDHRFYSSNNFQRGALHVNTGRRDTFPSDSYLETPVISPASTDGIGKALPAHKNVSASSTDTARFSLSSEPEVGSHSRNQRQGDEKQILKRRSNESNGSFQPHAQTKRNRAGTLENGATSSSSSASKKTHHELQGGQHHSHADIARGEEDLGTTKFRGVSYKRRENKWVAQIKYKGVQNYLGIYHTQEEAARAYDIRYRELYGETGEATNFPSDEVALRVCEAAARRKGTTLAVIDFSVKKQPSSTFRGVSFKIKDNKYVAQIRFQRKQHYLGIFETEEEAALAYDEAARKMHKERAKLNFPKDTDRAETSRSNGQPVVSNERLFYSPGPIAHISPEDYLGYHRHIVQQDNERERAARHEQRLEQQKQKQNKKQNKKQHQKQKQKQKLQQQQHQQQQQQMQHHHHHQDQDRSLEPLIHFAPQNDQRHHMQMSHDLSRLPYANNYQRLFDANQAGDGYSGNKPQGQNTSSSQFIFNNSSNNSNSHLYNNHHAFN